MGLANTVHGPDLASCLELCCLAPVPWAKNGFYIFKRLKKIKTRIIFGDTGKLCDIQIAVFINKILLEHMSSSHARLFSYHFWPLLHRDSSCTVEMESVWPNIFILGPLQKVCWSWLNEINLCMEEKSPKLCFFISIAVFCFSFQD